MHFLNLQFWHWLIHLEKSKWIIEFEISFFSLINPKIQRISSKRSGDLYVPIHSSLSVDPWLLNSRTFGARTSDSPDRSLIKMKNMYLNWFTIESNSFFEISGIYFIDDLDRNIIGDAIKKFQNLDEQVLPHFIHVGSVLTLGRF